VGKQRRHPRVVAWAWTTGYDSPLVDVTPGPGRGDVLSAASLDLPDDLASQLTAWVDMADVLEKQIQDDERETPGSRRVEQEHA
jgi:hypothetical protein